MTDALLKRLERVELELGGSDCSTCHGLDQTRIICLDENLN